MKQAIITDKAPVPKGPYSQAIRSGQFVFVSGQLPIDPAAGKITATTMEEQTTQVLNNIAAILEAAGTSLQNVVKVGVFLANMNDFPAFNATYERFFPGEPPARTTVQAVLPNGMLEIDAVAYVP